MKETTILRRIQEREIDLILLEEMHVSPPFCSFLASQAFGKDLGDVSLIDAQLSLTDPQLGESDLALILRAASGERIAILIENKITAPLQPTQGERYRLRGEKGVTEKSWAKYKTMIIAPRRYLGPSKDFHEYDVQLPYEDLRDWFASPKDDHRAVYRRRVFQNAIDNPTPPPQYDDRITALFHEYWKIANKEFPELAMPEPDQKRKGSNWFSFWPERKPEKTLLWHKADIGRVDLEIPGAADSVEKLRNAYGALLGPDVALVKAGKSAALRMIVPKMDLEGTVEAQVDAVRAGLKAAFLLLYLSQILPFLRPKGSEMSALSTKVEKPS